MKKEPIPVFFHPAQLRHNPLYEWSFGKKITHPETSARVSRILAAIEKSPSFSMRRPLRMPLNRLTDLHDKDLVSVLKTARQLPEGKTYYPSVFPRRDQVSSDPGSLPRAGYYCFDSGTPLTVHSWDAAYWSAASAWSAAKCVTSGEAPAAYALSRPPGHHAQRGLFGGYCYFNNAGLAARHFRHRGRVAIVDIDFHHGNGTQSIFYPDPKVFFASIHGDPRKFYPYFSGYAGETGRGEGRGTNLNVPLPAEADGQEYLRALRRKVLPAVRAFRPCALVISAGFDTFKHDPVGAFDLETQDFAEIAWELAGSPDLRRAVRACRRSRRRGPDFGIIEA
jgi:acetoin utilization deacetylase AcuC-like enzyme